VGTVHSDRSNGSRYASSASGESARTWSASTAKPGVRLAISTRCAASRGSVSGHWKPERCNAVAIANDGTLRAGSPPAST
jgi:hypothetical protein